MLASSSWIASRPPVSAPAYAPGRRAPRSAEARGDPVREEQEPILVTPPVPLGTFGREQPKLGPSWRSRSTWWPAFPFGSTAPADLSFISAGRSRQGPSLLQSNALSSPPK